MLKIFNFFRLTEADTLVIAETRKMLTKEIAPQSTKDKANLLSVNKVTRIVERAVKKIVEHKSAQQMGRIRWVRLLNEIRWSLHDAGYSNEFVSLVSEAIIAKSVTTKDRKETDVA